MEFQSIKEMSELKNNEIEVYKGNGTYLALLVDRISSGDKEIKQMVNGEVAAKFHPKIPETIQGYISKRVEKGIALKNLIHYKDRENELEISNVQTLKESRFMDESVNFESTLSLYGDKASIINKDSDNLIGIIISDKNMVKLLNQMFNIAWNASTPV
ncbi:MAG: hypothetical protein Q9M91_08575 [Candidatus Dojkabacteria bacterium]|nr:hypothetical protein [Candidatus Dojkabacteria bacterium]MDQ7021827.1 hypothetical protein [Candidatus Dojkabacteria bacterium]